MRVAARIELTPADRRWLESRARARSLPARLVERCRIVLQAAAGHTDVAIAAALGITRAKAARWRRRFLALGVAGLEKDAPRPGRTPAISAARKAGIVRRTTQEKPANATHWSTRSMAAASGVSPATVRRIWAANGLKPHRVDTFKLSRDPQFAEKLEDVAGLYLDPPEHALVLSCDEKSQIQALDRTQPGLPMKPGRAGTMTHDYKRHGTTSLFAALNTLDGSVIGLCQQAHRHQEWIKFLRFIDLSTPDDKQLHLIVDNYATHKHPRVQRWLRRHPRFHVHFTPTSSFWLNMVERFFRDLTHNRLRRSAFSHVADLIDAIHDYVDRHNQAPKPFIWTARAHDILAKVQRAARVLDKRQSV
ncbi:MAG: IS630 family transposase [Terriglobales bacterium]